MTTTRTFYLGSALGDNRVDQRVRVLDHDEVTLTSPISRLPSCSACQDHVHMSGIKARDAWRSTPTVPCQGGGHTYHGNYETCSDLAICRSRA